MLLPDQIYRHVPLIWLIMGVLFLIAGLAAGPDFLFFSACMLMGLISIGRCLWLFSARNSLTRHHEVVVLTETQKLDRKSSL